MSADHQQRVALLEAIARRYELKLFGNIAPGVPASSPLHRCFQGEARGADMYQALRRWLITLNSHIDMVGREAGNARLFEATGVGTFLLADFKDNLQRTNALRSRWRDKPGHFHAHVPATRGRHPAIGRQKLGWLHYKDRSRCALDGAVQNGQSASV